MTTLDASWTRSTQNVVYYIQVQPSSQTIVVDGTSTTITGLSQNTLYNVTIAADIVTSRNTQVFSDAVSLATLPGPPLAPTLVNVTHSTITVTAACTCSAQSPSGYQLIWSGGTSTSTNPTSPLTATGLSENTNVSLTVGGIYGSLRTTPSPASWFVTGPDKMAPPYLYMAFTTIFVLSWNPPTGDVTNFTYQLEYKASGNSPQTMDNLKVPSIELRGLTPNTEYEVTVKVTTPYGTSAKSNPAVNTVTSPLPPNITLTTLNDTSVRVTWARSIGGNASTVSQVQVTSSPAAFSYIATPFESTVVAGNLTGNTEYVLTVTEIYNNSQRSTAMKSVTTLSGPVTNITAHMTNSAANLMWTAPSGNIVQYRIMYGVNTTTVSGTQSGALISPLIPNTLYTFYIIPETAVGSGANASITTATDTAAVRDFTYTLAGQGVITISWSPPLGGNNLGLTGYSAMYTNGMTSLSSSVTQFNVAGLEEGVWHIATVVANYAAPPNRGISLSFAFAPSNVTILVVVTTPTAATLQLNPSKTAVAARYIIR
ncbi:receptor-type tyrosine-protein phosphatase eta-like [Ciona intestinalis]